VKFKLPTAYKKRERTELIATRVSVTDKKCLEDAAEQASIAVSTLVERLLHDYCEFLRAQLKKDS
jgi:hypothetical protein